MCAFFSSHFICCSLPLCNIREKGSLFFLPRICHNCRCSIPEQHQTFRTYSSPYLYITPDHRLVVSCCLHPDDRYSLQNEKQLAHIIFDFLCLCPLFWTLSGHNQCMEEHRDALQAFPVLFRGNFILEESDGIYGFFS